MYVFTITETIGLGEVLWYMEFKLNKIDTDIRRKLQEESSDKRVHNPKEIGPSKNADKEKKHEEHKKKNDDEIKPKRFITIDGIKYGKSINVEAEKNEKIYDENYKGRFLDLKK